MLFAAVGTTFAGAMVASGEVLFGLLFGTMFVGIPGIIHRTSRGPGQPGFVLTSDGILGAAEDEPALIAWSDVEALVWRGTGLTVNDAPCLALHAELADGRSLRVTSLPARRGREVDDVVSQVRASGLLPERVPFTDGPAAEWGRAAASGADATHQLQTAKSWADVPPAARAVIVVVALAFLSPFLIGLLIVPVIVAVTIGPIGVLVALVIMASMAVLLVRAAWQWRTPALACSFTVEGVVSDFGSGLTVPWRDGAELRVEPAARRHDLSPAEHGRPGWVVVLRRPDGESLRLSAVLANPSRVTRAVLELANARRLGLVPAEVELDLAPDLPDATAARLRSLWGQSG